MMASPSGRSGSSRYLFTACTCGTRSFPLESKPLCLVAQSRFRRARNPVCRHAVRLLLPARQRRTAGRTRRQSRAHVSRKIERTDRPRAHPEARAIDGQVQRLRPVDLNAGVLDCWRLRLAAAQSEFQVWPRRPPTMQQPASRAERSRGIVGRPQPHSYPTCGPGRNCRL